MQKITLSVSRPLAAPRVTAARIVLIHAARSQHIAANRKDGEADDEQNRAEHRQAREGPVWIAGRLDEAGEAQQQQQPREADCRLAQSARPT